MALTRLLPVLRAAIASNPNDEEVKRQFAQALFDADSFRELVVFFGSDGQGPALTPEIAYFVGRAALALGDIDVAVPCLKAATEAGVARASGYFAEALLTSRQPDLSLATALAGLERDPQDPKSFTIVVRALLARGEKDRLHKLCAALQRSGVVNGYLPSALLASATTSQQRQDVRALSDYSRTLLSRSLATSPAFRRALSSELVSHPHASGLPSSKATTGTGRRIQRLDLVGGPCARALLEALRERVREAFVAFVEGGLIDARAARDTDLHAWALITSYDGHETWHVHPGGLVSGVYYVELPKRSMDEPERGSIEFGPYPFADAEPEIWPRKKIAPDEDLLLLFPSYLAHRTFPTRSGKPRLCVAFDLVRIAE